jgi:hypothetical protein
VVEYAPNVQDQNACTVAFSHASTALVVTASTAWDATWTGGDGDGPVAGGGLAGLTQTATTTVTVDEVQNIVTR